MSDHKELLLLSNLPQIEERLFLDRLQGCFTHRNLHGPNNTKALTNFSGAQIKQVVVGPDHIAFLFNDYKVGRVCFKSVEVKPPAIVVPEKPTTGSAVPNAGQATPGQNPDVAPTANVTTGAVGQNPSYSSVANAANRSAKIRRVMMATRRAGQFAARSGVIVDRGRQLIPASSIPEDLIAQAQVVLQGKSREVIVRELQRTNLNVNEAVNNLLSREDDDEDMEEGDSYLPEELLTLLDAGLRNTEGIMEPDALYTGDYEYMMSRELAAAGRRREGRTDGRARPADNANHVKERYEFGDDIEYWTGTKENAFPPNVKKFVKIAAMQGELLALTDTGVLYGWKWQGKGDLTPHPINAAFFGSNPTDKVADIETSAFRAVISTAAGKIGSFVDSKSLGTRVAELLFLPLTDLPDGETIESIHVCPMFAAAKTKNALYWWGINPFNERRKVFEKCKSKAKKYQSVSSSDIKVGSEVRTKSNPVYATNSIAINMTTATPMIGVMMEAAWTLTETCRFRLFTPEQFDQMAEDLKIKDEKKAVNYDPQSGSLSSIPHKETAWAIKDVVFIHEESCNDTGIVQIIDGPICGIYFKSYIDEKKKSGDANDDISRLRLIRKDELVAVNSSTKQPLAPVTFEKTLQRVTLPHGIRRVVSLVVDTTGFRLLVEKKGRVHLIRMSTLGKLCSDHMLPVSYSAVCGAYDNTGRTAKLYNYGDESILYLQDHNGAISPLSRNSAGGYGDPVYLGVAGMTHIAVGVKYFDSSVERPEIILSAPVEKLTKPDQCKSTTKVLLLAALIAPSPREIIPSIPSILQLVLFCDFHAVSMVMKAVNKLKAELDESSFEALVNEYIINPRADGNRTILHAAIMNAFSKTNAIDAASHDKITFDTSEAEAHRDKMDKQWEDMIAGGGQVSKSVDVEMKSAEDVTSLYKVDLAMKYRVGQPVSDFKDRKHNAIAIIKYFMKDPIILSKLPVLLHIRDIYGHTPFICAVQHRAYEAACAIWETMTKYYNNLSVADFTNEVYNPMIHTDDSPLFIVCYNDTCSFTWTGDEHINQDIFECKTCGLVGSLCCCTECANTCHRNHDCKLKRTSPTAYCDCWEKCSCKALVAGNEVKREYLLNELLSKTNLIQHLNSRGEHLLLFLVKTVGRQLIEQDNYSKRSRNRATVQTANDNIPERDLEPPRFADRALKICLASWDAVKSLIAVGMKTQKESTSISEEHFHLGSQDGSTQLDKFVFILLNKCLEAHLDILLNTIIQAAKNEDDYEIHDYISRFTRSVVRMFSLVTLIAPSTLALTVQSASNNAEDDKEFKYSTSNNPDAVKTVAPARAAAAVAISGVISLVRSSSLFDRKEKKRNVNVFVQKCRRIFQTLPTYSIAELLNTADAYIGPVKSGFINPVLNISRAMHNTDALEYIEKFLNGEQDLSAFYGEMGEIRAYRRKRYGSRRDTDEEAIISNEDNGQGNAVDSDESESDSENEAVSRRFSSQGSLHGHTATSLSNVVNSYRRDEAPAPPQNVTSAPRPAAMNPTAADRGEYSTDSVSTASDDEENEDSSEDEESENDRNFGVIDPFNQEEFEDDEDMRENDEEEDDYYDEDGDEEAGHEFGEENEHDNEDEDNEGEHEFQNDEEGGNHGHNIPVVEIEPAEQAPEPEDGEIVGGNEMEVDNAANTGGNAHPEEALEMNEEDLMNAMRNEEVNITIAPESEAVSIAVSNDGPDVSSTRSRVINALNTVASGNRARNLTWAVPGEFSVARRDDGNANELVIRTNQNNGNEGNNADPNAQRASKAASGTSIVEDSHASSEKAAFQFAAVFAALLRVVDDLMLQITSPQVYNGQVSDKSFSNQLKIDLATISMFRNFIEEKMNDIWQWLTIVLDKVEAQLKFGSALNNSTLHSIEMSEKKTEKDKRGKMKENANVASSNQKKDSPHGRREFLQYFFSIARSHANENGDELPIIEYRALKTAAFVAEGFLFHASILELIDSRIQTYSSKETAEEQNEEKSDSVTSKKLRKFYERSNSICYPCISYADTHHAFQYTAEESLPLAARPQLLQPDSERCQLFTLPVPQRNKADHTDAAANHGVHYPTFHSLANLPTTYGDLRQFLVEQLVGPKIPQRSLFKTYISQEPLEDENKMPTVDELFAADSSVSRMPYQKVLGRWSNVFSLITQMYTEDLIHYCGGDATYSMILVETAGFQFRQAQFRRRIDKLKNGQPRDLVFSGMCRDKNLLIVQTFRNLNQQYQKRLTNGNTSSSAGIVLKMYKSYDANQVSIPPLASHKVKVTFKDEPGEGTGVARSFYSAVAEALITLPNMPQDGFEADDDKKKTASIPTNYPTGTPPKRLARGALQAIQASITRRVSTRRRQDLNIDAPPYYPPEKTKTPDVKTPENRSALASNRALAGERLFTKVYACEPVFAHKVTGMLLELPMNDILNMISCEDTMKAYLLEAVKLLMGEGYVNSTEKESDALHLREDAPFFARIENTGHYVPIPATCSENRINAFRNVGRMIGICLQQREIFPIQLARHVLKFILGKPLTWYDLAFFDTNLYDSMRSLIVEESTGGPQSKEFYDMLAMNFTLTFSEKEGGKTVELIPGGENIFLNRDNILEFFYWFVEKRLLGPVIPVLEAIKKGVFDVIPSDCLSHLSPEDLRLILCGSSEINMNILESYTKFLDESSSSSDTLEKYKQIFWSVVNKFTDQEKQDLVFFWTGSPTLPASEEEFQPLPSIMIRPSDNNMHLPTANTCISRLYLPLYTSKRVLRAKLLMAIKARNFGFV
uniref:E3 ubiquitin-protein ligase UBR5 n=1 Tax=Panagrolaimus sp. JU765 TaxID=591449 RepID=A0AC34RRG3_9BILA